jgi:hypothetical protein
MGFVEIVGFYHRQLLRAAASDPFAPTPRGSPNTRIRPQMVRKNSTIIIEEYNRIGR